MSYRAIRCDCDYGFLSRRYLCGKCNGSGMLLVKELPQEHPKLGQLFAWCLMIGAALVVFIEIVFRVKP